MLQIYTGSGKGKTTAALGMALRAVGQGMRVIMFSFLKDDPEYGEVKAYRFLPGFELYQVGRDSFVNFRNPDPIDVEMCRQGWERAKEAILTKAADLIILDEINIVLMTRLLPPEEVLAFLKQYKNNTEIVLTGRGAPEEFIKLADLVTDMSEVKHYFHLGYQSRTGFDH